MSRAVVAFMARFVLARAVAADVGPAGEHDLMPAPLSVEMREGGLSLDGALTAVLVGPASERLVSSTPSSGRWRSCSPTSTSTSGATR